METAVPTERGRCPGSTGTCTTTNPQSQTYDLAANREPTAADLDEFARLSGSGPDWVAISSADEVLPTLTTCFPGPVGLNANQAHVAAYRTVTGFPVVQTDREPITPTHPAYLIETVLHFVDESAAASAYSSIRDGAGQCDYSVSHVAADGLNTIPGWPVDELFTAEMRPTA